MRRRRADPGPYKAVGLVRISIDVGEGGSTYVSAVPFYGAPGGRGILRGLNAAMDQAAAEIRESLVGDSIARVKERAKA